MNRLEHYDKALDFFQQALNEGLQLSSANQWIIVEDYLHNISLVVRRQKNTEKRTTGQNITTLLENYKFDQDFGVIGLNTFFKTDDEFCLKLKRIFTNLAKVDEPCDAINHFTQNSKKLLYFVCIVSHLDEHFIPSIHGESIIHHMYVYCRNSQEQQQWIDKNHKKIKNKIFLNQNLLIKELRQFIFDAKQIRGKTNCQKRYHYHQHHQHHLHILNNFQLLIEIILRLSLSEKAKSDIIKVYHNYYSDNKTQKKYISVFESNYETKRPLEWYTDPQMKFCHKLTNKALGT
ncbi:unnamed protein product [Didymodactylos carnosus]|uniref:Uncharacterized protein n=1 Tax=Didymodactylos carnosus TaxID=1234261 RepID=A0A814TTW1_9BILA|nr:unnamed protein product [Didymodactylos carnosus]CAF3929423.1 unnamed protein product [Didymodactylos carnosus]